ncbi:unnamed protein product [Ceutorhynchus assimilis]|uniref:Uncharacterized protein n=1 Tax=Ceutorhynchus assimilis TaxID=467358 RepID=A0A9P0GR49_9CUCU|nr:unnamed protein product [Ceutorhynchus assimilis]
MATTDGIRPPNEQYSVLLSQHVRTLLESGLLLEEDYEVLLSASSFKIYNTKSTEYPLGSIVSCLTSAGCAFVAWRYNSPIILISSLIVSSVILYSRKKATMKARKRNEIVAQTVESFTKLRKLNIEIICYLKMRKSCKQKDSYLLNNEISQEFLCKFLLYFRKYFNFCFEQIHFLVTITQELADDFIVVKALNVESLLTTEIDSEDHQELLAAKVQDIYIFLSSKYLNYLGLTFCQNLKKLKEIELKILLDKNLPETNATLQQLHAILQKEFNNIRYNTLKKVEIDMRNRTNITRQVSGKLKETIMNAVNNLSIITEKSQAVLAKVEEAEGQDRNKLESALVDLRDHAFATYESLDVLCRLYGILSKSNNSTKEGNVVKFSKQAEQQNIAIINYDDPSEAREENYELFIPANEDDDKTDTRNDYEDQSSAYLSLMLKELRQSLKKHARFVAARRKRGIQKDEEDIDEVTNTNLETQVPKFDANVLKVEASERIVLEARQDVDNVPPIPPPRPSKIIPPPPPPPLTLLNSNLEQERDVFIQKTLVENIKALSSQLERNEEVFGDYCVSDSD